MITKDLWRPTRLRFGSEAVVILIAAVVYLTGLISPPHLMDDVDAAESLQAKNMLTSGDWVTQHLNGTIYLDKAPLKYWITASLYRIFGVHDWAARLPTAFAAILLCWLVVRMGNWSDTSRTGLYSGLVIATSIGLFLFTRTVIPDVILTLFIALSLWCFFRLLECEQQSTGWALGMYAAMACAVLTKGLIGLVFPVGIGLTYLLVTRQLTTPAVWRRLCVGRGALLFLAIAAPWHVIAAVRNPPVFDLALHPGADFGGKFRGFFWFYFINEQALRFLNERWPRDYNTVPRLWFWLYHVAWFLPWSFFLPVASQLSFKPVDRAARMRLLALCWTGFVMIFFTFSTTQEYYSMPLYPALALLLGSAMSSSSKWLPWTSKAAGAVILGASAMGAVILFKVWPMPRPGDLYTALSQHPDLYTLSLGHMADLTFRALAYLRLPLLVACLGLCFGGLAILLSTGRRAYLAMALTLVVFFQAARQALIAFDPYLSSYAIAQKLNQLPKGLIVICGKYNPLSSVFFYGPDLYGQDAALQNEKDLDILEYGSLAPGAPQISVTDTELKRLWASARQVYVVTKVAKLEHLQNLLGSGGARIIFRSADKYLLANQPGR